MRYQPFHHGTLLDGEMVVDEDRDSGKHMYRYLAYDVMAIDDKPVVDQPWKVCSVPDLLCSDCWASQNRSRTSHPQMVKSGGHSSGAWVAS